MRGAFLIADGAEALASVREALLGLGADEVPGELLQLRQDDGSLFNVFTNDSPARGSAWREGVREGGSAALIPDVEVARAWWVECRSASAFVRNVTAAVAAVPGRAWVLDDADVLWPADEIDPERLVL